YLPAWLRRGRPGRPAQRSTPAGPRSGAARVSAGFRPTARTRSPPRAPLREPAATFPPATRWEPRPPIPEWWCRSVSPGPRGPQPSAVRCRRRERPRPRRARRRGRRALPASRARRAAAADAWRTGECPPRSRSVVSGPAGAVILRWVASCASVEFGVLPPDRARQRTIVGHELDDRVSELFQRQPAAFREPGFGRLRQRG